VRARIHRGAAEVGGSCVELEAEGKRLVLDAGLPLSLDGVLMRDLLPEVHGLWADGDGSLLALLVSHGHRDHSGLVDLVAPSVPVYAGEATVRIAAAAAFFSPMRELDADRVVADGHEISIGPFRVTPVLVDHSAFDAYAFVIRAGARTLVYSGDLRAHGRKPRSVERLATAAAGADVLLLEGTRIGRQNDNELTEADVERRIAELCDGTRGLVFAAASGQNVDRLVSLYRAARRAGRELVLDLYAASVLAAAGRASLPSAGARGLRVFLPAAQRARVIASGQFERIEAVRAARVFAEEITAHPDQFLMLFRGSMADEVQLTMALDDAVLGWSMWHGYLDTDERIRAFLAANRIPLHTIHASGHASVNDLVALIRACAPERVVPIHTNNPSAFVQLSDNVELHRDGEWWSV